MIDDVMRGYAQVTAEWIARSEAISPEQLYAHVADLLPVSPSTVVDIGAGTGRDAAWLAGLGHDVTAIEPVAELRQAAMARHASSKIRWLDDRLPDLSAVQNPDGFDLVLVNGVWQHLDDAARSIAMQRLAELTAIDGTVIISLRHGPGAPGRPVHQVRPEDTVNSARERGLSLVRQREAGSIQAANRTAGVHWTWLAFTRR